MIPHLDRGSVDIPAPTSGSRGDFCTSPHYCHFRDYRRRRSSIDTGGGAQQARVERAGSEAAGDAEDVHGD
jgi:hypothetical protein